MPILKNLDKFAFRDDENLHVNLCNLNIKQIKEFIDLYKQSLCNPKMTYYIKAKYIKRHIKDIRGSGKYYDENLDFHLKNEIVKL